MADFDSRSRVPRDPSERSTDKPAEARAHTPWGTVGGRVLCLVSRKGGVGKTTSAVNLGAAFALSGHTVLLVGADPQCGICRTLGQRPDELPVSLTDLFDCGEQIEDLVQVSPLSGLHYLSPRVPTLEDEQRFLDSLERRAAEFVREIERARNLYDTIIIDCPPGMGPAARAALLAADGYLVPVQAEELCRESLDSLLAFVDEFRARNFEEAVAGEMDAMASALALEGLFLTMVNGRTRVGRHVAARVAEDFDEVLCAAQVPRTTRLAEMAMRGRPAVIYDRRSPGSRAYFDLADELVARYCREHAAPAETDTGQERWDDDERTAVVAAGGRDLRGFERFLHELAGGEPGPAAQAAGRAEDPELVPLEQLLEEDAANAGRDDRDDGYWSADPERYDRIN